jgi:hypothetical protein
MVTGIWAASNMEDTIVMKKTIIGLFVLCTTTVLTASPVSNWKVVDVSGGEVTGVSSVHSGTAKEISPGSNEYPFDYAFPTNAFMYWKKVGTDWVEMDAAEKLAVDASKQEQITVLATDDAINDALIAAIAEAIKQNAKTYDEVKAIFKGKVNPKKANKKVKDKK